MATKNQGAQIGVFHILKSVVDGKLPGLQESVAVGKRAQTEQPILVDNIKSLRQYVSNCRAFDPSEYREATADLDDKEMQLDGIQRRIDSGRTAERELAYAALFNTTYNTVCKRHNNASRIRELKKLREELYERQYRLDDKIWACQLNMDLACRLPGLVNQAQEDANKYMTQYNELAARIQAINTEIEQLQR